MLVKESRGSFDPVSEGPHPAVCSSVVDLGEQVSEWQGQKCSRRKVRITWEVPEELVEIDGDLKPKIISKEYTFSLSDKSRLREHLESWRGRAFAPDELRNGFEMRSLLGMGCLILVQHETGSNGNIYAAVKTIMALPKGTPCPELSGEPLLFDLDEPDCLKKMDRLSPYVREKVERSHTYQEALAQFGGDFSDVEEDGQALPF